MKLKNIANIDSGLVTTRKKARIEYDIEENYKLLNLNAIDEFGTINQNELHEFESIESLSNQYFTQEDDILIRLSEPYTAVYINHKNTGILIPSYFVKLQIKDSAYKAGYIAWYLNSQRVKREFFRSQSGTRVSSINQKLILDLDIPEKTLEEQELIVNIYKLHLRENELNKQLVELRKEQFSGITQKLLKDKGE